MQQPVASGRCIGLLARPARRSLGCSSPSFNSEPDCSPTMKNKRSYLLRSLNHPVTNCSSIILQNTKTATFPGRRMIVP